VAQTHDKYRDWFKRLRRWVLRVLGFRSAHSATPRILRAYEREHLRLLLLDSPYSDEHVERIAVWRGILRSPSEYDVLLTCDRFKRAQPKNVSREKPFRGGYPTATHRLAVLRVSRILVKGQIRTDCLFLADVDLVGLAGVLRGVDGYAPVVLASMALQLTKRTPAELKLLLEFEADRGQEDTAERERVWLRWRDVLRAYAQEYYLGDVA
jgi:hypothetical protein